MAKRTRESQGLSDLMDEPTPHFPKERLKFPASPDDQDAARDEADQAEEGKPAEAKPPKSEPRPLDAKEEQLCVDVAAILLEDATKDLKRRYDAGVRLNQEYPDRIQPRDRGVFKAAATRCGLHPSDLYRMRTFARTFATFEVFAEKYPEVKTWSKTKEVLAEENKQAKEAGASNDNKDVAVAAKKKAAKEQQARERAKKEFIQLIAELRKKVKKVPLTRLMLEEAASIEEAFQEIATALTPLVGPIKAIKSAIKDKAATDKATP